MELHYRFIENLESDRVNLILKPTNKCNLSCPYCYNRSKSRNEKMMTAEEAIYIINKVLCEYKDPSVTFHGGEPLLMGKDWYRMVCSETRKIANEKGCHLSFNMQTNGTLVDEEYIEIFKKYNIKVGFSFDGTENDHTRKSTEKLLKSFNLFKENIGSCSAGLIVTNNNAHKLIEEFELFEKLGVHPKFDPVFNADEIREGLFEDLDKNKVLNGYKELFDYYIQREDPISTNIFDIYIDGVFGFDEFRMRSCDLSICNFRWVSVAPNGDIYPCGREWTEDYKIGNIYENTIKEAFCSEKYLSMVMTINERVQNCFKTCEYAKYCYGACPATILSNTGKFEGLDKSHCMFLKGLYDHIETYFMDVTKPVNNKKVIQYILNNNKVKINRK